MTKGFTLIELLLAMAIMGILATTLVVSVNPARQFAKARDTERESDIYSIVTAILQYSSEHSGALPDDDGDPDVESFPTAEICIGTDAACFDLAGSGDDGDVIVPVYFAVMPMDPQGGTPEDTGYTIYVDANNRLHASAPNAETKVITITR